MSLERHIAPPWLYARPVKVRAAGALVVAGVLLAAPAQAADVGVRVGSFYFEDASAGDGRVVVEAGDRLAFTFEGGSTHSATVDGLFDSGRRSSGETYVTSALMRPGTYTLYCTVHGAQQHGATLQVRGSASAAPSPSRAASPSPSPSPSPRLLPSLLPRRSPSPSPAAPSASPSPKPSPSVSVIAAPALPSSAAPTLAESPSPSASPEAVALPEPDPTDDDGGGTGWLLPTALALLVGGLGAIAYALRRRGVA